MTGLFSVWVSRCGQRASAALPRVRWSRKAEACPETSEGTSAGGDAHGTSGALDDLHGRLFVVRVEVGHLGPGDLTHLFLGQLADLLLVRDAGALLQTCGLLDELRGRRGLGDERERTILVDGDLDGDDVAAHRLGLGVVRLAEVHDVHAVRTESGTDGRGRRRGTGLELHLDECGDLLLRRHSSVFLSWS